MSAATIDRLLRPVRTRTRAGRRGRRRPNRLLKQQIPVRTFSELRELPPGFCEADLVVHNGGVTSGACAHSLVVTDVSSGWTEYLTRSRADQKNDQAWIEQKNGSVVRRLVGYSRFASVLATHTLGRLYQFRRLYVNFFSHPSGSAPKRE